MKLAAAAALVVAVFTPYVGRTDLQSAPLQSTPQSTLRTIYVTVTEGKNASVAGLTATDFVVKEDGKARTIDHAEPATTPMQIALMLDDGGLSLGADPSGRGTVR